MNVRFRKANLFFKRDVHPDYPKSSNLRKEESDAFGLGLYITMNWHKKSAINLIKERFNEKAKKTFGSNIFACFGCVFNAWESK